jgi:hypothetical protein
MNHAKTASAVYQMCAAYDAYMPELNPDTAKAWGSTFARYELAPADLFAAVQRIFAERTTTDRGERYRVAVADIAQMARNIRRERAERESAEQQAARLEERDRRLAAITYDAPALAVVPSERRYEEPATAGAKFTPCQVCGAKAGNPCRNPYTQEVKLGFHPERERLAAARADERRAPLGAPDPRESVCPRCDSTAGQRCQEGGLPMWDIHPERRP